MLSVVTLFQLKHSLLEDREEKAANLVQFGVGVLDYFQQQANAGKLSQGEAQSFARNALRNLRYGALGSAYSERLRTVGLDVADGSSDNQVNLRKLLSGRGRFFYQGEHALQKSIEAAGLADQIRLLPTVFGKESQYFWVSRKQPDIVAQKIEKALASLAASGEIQSIDDRYFSR